MPDKKHPPVQPDIPVPDQEPAVLPPKAPEVPQVPDDTPETIPQERPMENPPPEIPQLPGGL